jgi:ornithine decarboxylase
MESFYIVKMSVLKERIGIWKQLLPDIKPYYAIKCNPNPVVMGTMLEHDFGFDAASRDEIKMALDLGCKPDSLIYANPVKRINDLKFASNQGIKRTTVDSTWELEKFKHHDGGAISPLLRLKIDNPNARVNLGTKYGATHHEYKKIIDYASNIGVNISGVSFHVGSDSKNPGIFEKAIWFSKEVHEYGKKKGHTMDMLDIGGGFTFGNIKQSSLVLNKALREAYKGEKLQFIAEPGRYFVEDVFTFFTPVIGKRVREGALEYWVGDSLYGSFNSVIYDGQKPGFVPICVKKGKGGGMVKSIIYGQTCDSFDIIEKKVELPEMEYGDFLMIENFGAYTVAGACDFNGLKMSKPVMFYLKV